MTKLYLVSSKQIAPATEFSRYIVYPKDIVYAMQVKFTILLLVNSSLLTNEEVQDNFEKQNMTSDKLSVVCGDTGLDPTLVLFSV